MNVQARPRLIRRIGSGGVALLLLALFLLAMRYFIRGITSGALKI